MDTNLIAPIASILVIAITVIGQWINSRNDRNLTNQELDILKKLDSNSTAARELSAVIQFRIAKWHRRIAKSRQLLRGTIVWGVISYLLFLVILQIAPRPKDVDLILWFGALILFGSVAFAVAVIRLVQFLKRHRQEHGAVGPAT
jgi:hypothetical protein